MTDDRRLKSMAMMELMNETNADEAEAAAGVSSCLARCFDGLQAAAPPPHVR